METNISLSRKSIAVAVILACLTFSQQSFAQDGKVQSNGLGLSSANGETTLDNGLTIGAHGELKIANGITNANHIEVGQTLIIPRPGEIKLPATTTSPATSVPDTAPPPVAGGSTTFVP